MGKKTLLPRSMLIVPLTVLSSLCTRSKTLLCLALTLPDALQRCPELADSLRDKWGHLEKIGFDVNVRAALFQPCNVIQAKHTAAQGSDSAERLHVP